MEPIDIFSLEKHDGPYESWPLTSELRRRGEPTGARVPGYVIEAQYRCGDRYLLATSWDCPFEEMQTFVLLSSELKVLARRDYGAAYATVWMTGHVPIGPDTVVFHCNNGCDVLITVRARRPLWLGSLLKMRVVSRGGPTR
jgi:hypothetical protein